MSSSMQRSASLSCLKEEYKYIAAIVNPLSGERAASDYVYQSLCQELGHHRVLRLTKEIFADTRPIKNLIMEYTAVACGTSGHVLPSTRQAGTPSKRGNNNLSSAAATDSSTPLLGASSDPTPSWGAVTPEPLLPPSSVDYENSGDGKVATSATKLNSSRREEGGVTIHGDDLYDSTSQRQSRGTHRQYFPSTGTDASTSLVQQNSNPEARRGVIIVAGGDGTVSFIMQVIDQLAAELTSKAEAKLEQQNHQSSGVITTPTPTHSPTNDGGDTVDYPTSPPGEMGREISTLSRTGEEELKPAATTEDDSINNNIQKPKQGKEGDGDNIVLSGSDDDDNTRSGSSPERPIGTSPEVDDDISLPPPSVTSSTTVPTKMTAEDVASVQAPTKVHTAQIPILPAVAVIAMGTGNDLSNWLGFGLGYTKYKCQPCGACCCCMTSCSGKHPGSARPRNCCINSVEDAVTSLASAMIPPSSNQPLSPSPTSSSSGDGCRIVQFDRWTTRVVPLSVIYTAVCALRAVSLSSSASGSHKREGSRDSTASSSTHSNLGSSPSTTNNPSSGSNNNNVNLRSVASSPHLLRLQSMANFGSGANLSSLPDTSNTITEKQILNGLANIINKNYTHIAMNYFSFGMDAFIATTFDKLRKQYPNVFQYRLVNKMVYGNLGLYGWQKCQRLDPYIKSLEVGVDENVANFKNNNKNAITTATPSSSDGPKPQRLQSAAFPVKIKAFVAANVGSYSGGVTLWDPESGAAKNKYLVGARAKKMSNNNNSNTNGPLVTGASVSDCRLEVQGVGGMVEMGMLQLKVTSADKVAQTSVMRTVLGMPGPLPIATTTSKSTKSSKGKGGAAGDERHIGVPIIATRDPEVSLEELAVVLPTVVTMPITDDLLIAVRAQLNHYYRRDSAASPMPTPKFTPPIAFQVDGEPSGTIPEPSVVEISPYSKPMFVVAKRDKHI